MGAAFRGTRIGSIGGGCLENDILLRNWTVAETGRADLVVSDTTSENDVVWRVGTGCHGVSIQIGNAALIL